jgi:large subunit ribosomal protein L19
MAKTAEKEKISETKGAKARTGPLKKAVIPRLTPGDTVKVTSRIIEGDKERTQLFQGVILKVKEGAEDGNFTVRRVAYGVGVERTFPLASPMIAKVEVVRHGRVRRARLFYLRELSGKAARIKEKRLSKEKLAMIEAAGASSEEIPPEAVPETTPEATAPETPAA